jgi:hypothetical protein
VTDSIAGMGPSAIDVALSSLCNGMHDLKWVTAAQIVSVALEACESGSATKLSTPTCTDFYLHVSVITGVDDSFQFDNEAVPTEEEKLEKNRRSNEQSYSTRFRSYVGHKKGVVEALAARCSILMSAASLLPHGLVKI